MQKCLGMTRILRLFSRKNRALNFNTTISEGSGILEFTITSPEKWK